MRLLAGSLHIVEHSDQQLLDVGTKHVGEESAFEVLVLWVLLSLEASLVEGIWGHCVRDLWGPQFLQFVDPEVDLSWEAATIKASATNKSELGVVATSSVEWLVLLDHEGGLP